MLTYIEILLYVESFTTQLNHWALHGVGDVLGQDLHVAQGGVGAGDHGWEH